MLGPHELKRLAKAIPKANPRKRTAFGVWLILAAGLLVREGRKLAAPWDEVQASVMLA